MNSEGRHEVGDRVKAVFGPGRGLTGTVVRVLGLVEDFFTHQRVYRYDVKFDNGVRGTCDHGEIAQTE